jgi:hypothetical protein
MFRDMKEKIILALAIIILLGFSRLPVTGSLLLDNEASSQNQITAGNWAVLSFYSRSGPLEVGFKILNVSSFDRIKYRIDYLHDGGLHEHIEGLIDNASGQNSIVREGLRLGGCSTLGLVCWDHEVEGDVTLEVVLMQSGVEVQTLSKSILI